MRITKAEDACFLAGAIVAYRTTDITYGSMRGDILGNGLIFAKIGYCAARWDDAYGKDKGIGLDLFVFSKVADQTFSHTSLTTKNLQQYQKDYNDYLDVRYATLEEVKLLKKLAENGRIVLGHRKTTDTAEILANYLNEEIPPKPSIILDFKEGKVTTHLDIDFHNMNKEKAAELNSKYRLDISLDILSEIQSDTVPTLGDKQVGESEL